MPEKHKPSANVGVSVLVRRGESILLEKHAHVHSAGTWGPPSGHIDFGETPEATAQRETSEETGVEIAARGCAEAPCVTHLTVLGARDLSS